MFQTLKANSHGAKANAKAKIFFDLWIFSLISPECSLIFFAFAFVFAQCEWLFTVLYCTIFLASSAPLAVFRMCPSSVVTNGPAIKQLNNLVPSK